MNKLILALSTGVILTGTYLILKRRPITKCINYNCNRRIRSSGEKLCEECIEIPTKSFHDNVKLSLEVEYVGFSGHWSLHFHLYKEDYLQHITTDIYAQLQKETCTINTEIYNNLIRKHKIFYCVPLRFPGFDYINILKEIDKEYFLIRFADNTYFEKINVYDVKKTIYNDNHVDYIYIDSREYLLTIIEKNKQRNSIKTFLYPFTKAKKSILIEKISGNYYYDFNVIRIIIKLAKLTDDRIIINVINKLRVYDRQKVIEKNKERLPKHSYNQITQYNNEYTIGSTRLSHRLRNHNTVYDMDQYKEILEESINNDTGLLQRSKSY